MNKELEAFEELRSSLSKTFVISDVANEKFDLIETALKAFEIIKEKKVNVLELSTCANYETYLAFFNKWNWNGEYDKYILTQEEYNLLKEALL